MFNVLNDLSIPPAVIPRAPLKDVFANAAIKDLISTIDREMPWYREHILSAPVVIQAFKDFKTACSKKPAIVNYAEEILAPDNPKRGFTQRQIELLSASLLFRSTSTYAVTPQVVADLCEHGLYRYASMIENNAYEEVGSKDRNSHADMLYHSVAIISNALHCYYLNKERFPIARIVLNLRKELGEPYFGNFEKDFDRFKNIIHRQGIILATHRGDISREIDRKEFNSAVYFCNLVHPEIGDYHNYVFKFIKGENRTPSEKMAANCLDLAVREASSVDQPKERSYIGIWDEVVKNYLGYIDSKALSPLIELQEPMHTAGIFSMMRTGWENGKDQTGYKYSRYTMRRHAAAWSSAHIDHIHKSEYLGTFSAEDQHAFEARTVSSLCMFSIDSVESFARVLNDVTKLVQIRLKFWEDTVSRMKELGESHYKTNLHLTPVPYIRKRFFFF